MKSSIVYLGFEMVLNREKLEKKKEKIDGGKKGW